MLRVVAVTNKLSVMVVYNIINMATHLKIRQKNNYNYLNNNNTPFKRSKNYLDSNLDCNQGCNLDRDPEVVPIYTGHSLFYTTKRITLLFIVQTLLHRNLDNIGIKVI